MNEFSKEELIMLKRLTLQHVNEFRQNSDCAELLNKIISLIDKYCEHNWRKDVHLFDDIYCTKCSKNFEVNQIE